MMGDRFGEIVKISRQTPAQAVRAALLTNYRRVSEPREIAHVKLDKSGKTVRVILDDCVEV
jgi:azurin